MENNDKLKRAKKRVEQLKGFHIHLVVYLAINLLIMLGNVLVSVQQGEPPFRWHMLVTPFFWGIGLAIHALNVYGPNLLFGKKWEARQIAKYMEEERREAEKYK